MSKRPAEDNNPSAGGSDAPIKRSKPESSTEHIPATTSSAVPSVTALGGGDSTVPSSSPAATRETDSPSARSGNRGPRGKGERGGKRGGRGGRDGPDSRAWGGRSDNARGGMRTWGAKEGEAAPAPAEDKKERYPKKKVVLMIGYNGAGYFGSQINPGFDTIEGEVFKACVAAGAISEDNSVNPQKVNLCRAARTDAGVSAAVNVVCLKLIVAPPNLPAGTRLEDYLNAFLPPAIRVWAIIGVQGGFDPRHGCDQRHYEYTLPTHVFLAPKPGCAMAEWIQKSRTTKTAAPVPSTSTDAEKSTSEATENAPVELAPEAIAKADVIPITETPAEAIPTTFASESVADDVAIAASAAFWAAQPENSTFAMDAQAKKMWRISPELLESARKFVKAYEGSHNYYNYTVQKDFRDRSCQRVMRELKISDPFIVKDTEFVAVTFLGQSFMLHQIRKMIGVAILAIRSSTPASLIPETFGPSRIHTPKAPALGLLLLEPQYIEYNKRLVESNIRIATLLKDGKLDAKAAEEQTREPVVADKFMEAVNAFKAEAVYTKMMETEEAGAVYANWLNYLDVHIGPDFEYLNSKGIIPESAVFKKGENAEKIRLAAGAVVAEGVVAPEEDAALPAGAEEEG